MFSLLQRRLQHLCLSLWYAGSSPADPLPMPPFPWPLSVTLRPDSLLLRPGQLTANRHIPGPGDLQGLMVSFRSYTIQGAWYWMVLDEVRHLLLSSHIPSPSEGGRGQTQPLDHVFYPVGPWAGSSAPRGTSAPSFPRKFPNPQNSNCPLFMPEVPADPGGDNSPLRVGTLKKVTLTPRVAPILTTAPKLNQRRDFFLFPSWEVQAAGDKSSQISGENMGAILLALVEGPLSRAHHPTWSPWSSPGVGSLFISFLCVPQAGTQAHSLSLLCF